MKCSGIVEVNIQSLSYPKKAGKPVAENKRYSDIQKAPKRVYTECSNYECLLGLHS